MGKWMSLPVTLRRVRERAGVSMGELARFLKATVSEVSAIEMDGNLATMLDSVADYLTDAGVAEHCSGGPRQKPWQGISYMANEIAAVRADIAEKDEEIAELRALCADAANFIGFECGENYEIVELLDKAAGRRG